LKHDRPARKGGRFFHADIGRKPQAKKKPAQRAGFLGIGRYQ